MKTISFEHLEVKKPTERARNQREDLIEQIVAQCTFRQPGDDRKLARLLAIAANTGGWDTTDLHYLLKKKQDPTLRNYTAFVWSRAKITKRG